MANWNADLELVVIAAVYMACIDVTVAAIYVNKLVETQGELLLERGEQGNVTSD